MWIMQRNNRKALNLKHIVSVEIQIQGEGTYCWIVLTDILGREHKSESFPNLTEAEQALSLFIPITKAVGAE
jgi:hypothetical protein